VVEARETGQMCEAVELAVVEVGKVSPLAKGLGVEDRDVSLDLLRSFA
jgi:hypothetical protein